MDRSTDSSALWWMVPGVGFVVLVALAVVVGGQPGQGGTESSYDATPEGVRAAYLLLEELGYPVTRSKRPAGRGVKWVLFPTHAQKDVDVLDRWVRDGGTLVLGAFPGEFTAKLGLRLQERRLPAGGDEAAAEGLGVTQLDGGRTEVSGPDPDGRVVVRAGGAPFVSVHPWGRGEVWLLNRPDFLRNRLIARADNGVLVCRLAEAVLEQQPGGIEYDEYFHGQRERPGVTDLLLQPPTVWVTLQGVLLAGFILWHVAPRFGAVRAEAPAARRSRTEFLEAMATLLERKGDYADAYRTARDDLLRELSRDLGLPAGTPPLQVARAAARRRPVSAETLETLLSTGTPPETGTVAFLRGINELERVRAQYFSPQGHKEHQEFAS
jgi:hypothetical protein